MTDTTSTLIPPAEVAKRVLHRIETEPDSHEQSVWVRWPGRPPEPVLAVSGAEMALDAIRAGRCGTAACVAGWAVIEALDMGAALDPAEHISDAAAAVLGLDPGGADATAMFYSGALRHNVTRALAAIAAGRRPPKP